MTNCFKITSEGKLLKHKIVPAEPLHYGEEGMKEAEQAFQKSNIHR